MSSQVSDYRIMWVWSEMQGYLVVTRSEANRTDDDERYAIHEVGGNSWRHVATLLSLQIILAIVGTRPILQSNHGQQNLLDGRFRSPWTPITMSYLATRGPLSSMNICPWVVILPYPRPDRLGNADADAHRHADDEQCNEDFNE